MHIRHNSTYEAQHTKKPPWKTWRDAYLKFKTSEGSSIFRLKIYICRLKIRICNLKICIFSLKIELSQYVSNFSLGIGKFSVGGIMFPAPLLSRR